MNKTIKRLCCAFLAASVMTAGCALIPRAEDGAAQDGLLIHITFDEENTDAESFKASFGGTVTKHGSVSFTESYDKNPSNKAMTIASGSAENYLELPKGLLSGCDAATFAFWIKPESGWAFMTTPVSSQSYLNEKYLGMLATPKGFKAESYNNAGARPDDVYAKAGFTEWSYVTAVFTESGTSVYVNGILRAADSLPHDVKSLMTEDASTWIGHGNWGEGEGFAGSIDDLRIYARALDINEISALSSEARKMETEKINREKNFIDVNTQFYKDGEKAFQISAGETLTVKTTVTNYTAQPCVTAVDIIPYNSNNERLENRAAVPEPLNPLETYEFSDSITCTEGVAYYRINVSCADNDSNYDGGYLPVSDVSFPDASPEDGFGSTAGAHDPTIFKDPVSGHYFAYSTHNSIAESEDLIHWTSKNYNNVITVPDSNKQFVADSAFTGGVTANGTYWAPDILYKEGDSHPYRFYVSTATNGNPRDSVIGLVKSDSPRIWDGDWIDCGVVLASTKAADSPTNAIDPNIYTDTDGKIYFIWGSFWRGIHMAELDPETGYVKGVDRSSVATVLETSKTAGARMFSTPKGIAGPEGPFAIYNPDTGFRYMFTSFGWLGSNYNIRVARTDKSFAEVLQKDAHKQLLDYKGRAVGTTYGDQKDTSGFYGYKMSGSFKLGDGIEYVGSGHNSVLRDDDGEWYLVQHCRKVAESIAYLQVKKLLWTKDGWPVISPLVYAGEKEQKLPEQMLCGTWDLSSVGHTIFADGVSSVNVSGAYKGTDLPVHSSKIVLKSDGSLGDRLGKWSFDGDHTVTVIFERDGNEAECEYFKAGDVMTLYALTGYDKDKRESAVVLTGVDQNGITAFAKKNNASAADLKAPRPAPEISEQRADGGRVSFTLTNAGGCGSLDAYIAEYDENGVLLQVKMKTLGRVSESETVEVDFERTHSGGRVFIMVWNNMRSVTEAKAEIE